MHWRALVWVLLLLILVASLHLQQRLHDAKERCGIGMGQLRRLHNQSSLQATGEYMMAWNSPAMLFPLKGGCLAMSS